MASGGPWSVRGIDPRAQEAALKAAQREGKSLGDWLNAIILDEDEEAPAPDAEPPRRRFGRGAALDEAGESELADGESLIEKLKALSARVEAAEQRATLAVAGMDQSLLGVIARLESLETSGGEAAKPEALEDVKQAQQTLADRLKALEEASTGDETRRAVKSLEQAVSTVAGHVHQRDRRDETRLSEIEDKLDTVDAREKRSAEDLARRVDAASDHAAMQARRESESVRQAFETHKEASESALSALRETVERIRERLDSAESLNVNAVRALEASFVNLDDRVKAAEAKAETPQTPALDARLDKLEAALSRSQRRHDAVLAKIGEQVGKLGEAVDRRMESAERRMKEEVSQERGLETRLRELETNATGASRRLGDEVAKIAERLAERMDSMEGRVTALSEQAETAQDDALETRLRESETRTQDMIREAVAGFGSKLDALRDDHEQALSPVQAAMADLAERLEAIEGGGPATASDASQPSAAEPALPPAETALLDDDEDEEDAFYVDEDPVPASPAPEARQNPFVSSTPAPDSDSESDSGEALDSPYEGDGDILFVDENPPQPGEDPAREPAGETEQAAPPDRPARLGATADPNFLRAMRSNVRQSAPDAAPAPESSPILEPKTKSERSGGGARIAMMGAGALATVALIAAAGVLVLSPDDQPAPARADADLTLNDLLGEGGTAPVQTAIAEPEAVSEAAADDGTSGDSARAESLEALAASLDEPASAPAPEAVDATAPEAADPAEPQPEAEPEPPAPPPDPVESALAALNPQDQFALGLAYLDAGEAAPALRLVRSAAENGLPSAQYRLGKMYETGTGLESDSLQARIWTERAAEAGNRKAMHNLGVMLAEGRGAPQDMRTAAQWFERAALLGSTDSQFNLAVLYEQGRGLPRSRADALAWFSIASRNGDAEAGQRAEALAGDLPPEAAQEARRVAAGFSPRPLDASANRSDDDGPVRLDGAARVAWAQALLSERGYDAGPADGALGERTRQAVIQYQSEAGMAATGEITPDLIARLEVSRSGE